MVNYKELDSSVLALFLGYETDGNNENYATSILLNPRPGQNAFLRHSSVKGGYWVPLMRVHTIDDRLKNVAIGASPSLCGTPFAFEQVKVPLLKRLPGGEFAYHVATVKQLDDFHATVHFEHNDRLVPVKSRRIKLQNTGNISIKCGDAILLKRLLGKWAVVQNITQANKAFELNLAASKNA